MSEIKHDISTFDNVGKQVNYWGRVWQITGINYLGDYDVLRFEDRPGGRYRIHSSCVLGLPADHPHYATLVEDTPNA